MTPSSTASTEELQALVDDLLVRDAGVHAEATATLAEGFRGGGGSGRGYYC